MLINFCIELLVWTSWSISYLVEVQTTAFSSRDQIDKGVRHVHASLQALAVMAQISRQRILAVDKWLNSLAQARHDKMQAESKKIQDITNARLLMLEQKRLKQQQEIKAETQKRRQLLLEYKAAAECAVTRKAAAKAKVRHQNRILSVLFGHSKSPRHSVVQLCLP